MERIKVVCPSCNNEMLRFLNPEIEVNKIRCPKCNSEVEVKFRNDEIQLWEEVMEDE